MNAREALVYLQAILDDTLDPNDPTDAKRIKAVEYAVATLRRRADDVRPQRRNEATSPRDPR
jgi:hypothetical protein